MSGAKPLALRPLSFAEACAFIDAHHRHHKRPQGHKFSIGAESFGELIGVTIVGRPVARGLDDGFTAEVTRLCTTGAQNACSLLYGAAARTAKAMGFRRIITYTLASESGRSLRAAGWAETASVRGRSWTAPSRPRTDNHPTEDKTRWERDLGNIPVWAGLEEFL